MSVSARTQGSGAPLAAPSSQLTLKLWCSVTCQWYGKLRFGRRLRSAATSCVSAHQPVRSSKPRRLAPGRTARFVCMKTESGVVASALSVAGSARGPADMALQGAVLACVRGVNSGGRVVLRSGTSLVWEI